MNTAHSLTETRREGYVDTLRVVNIFLLVLYHSALVFSPNGWFVENPQKSPLLGTLTTLPIVLIPMPLLILLAGMNTWHSLQKRTGKQYVLNRLRRIGIPLVLGIMIVIPPHVYIERVSRGSFDGNYLDFYPLFFTTGVVPKGNFTYRHLWFLAYLLALSLITTPLFLHIINRKEKILSDKLVFLFIKPGAIFLWAAPIIISESLLRPSWPTTYHILADWANLTLFFVVFVYGFALSSDQRFFQAIGKQWRIALIAGVFFTALSLQFWDWKQTLGYDLDSNGPGTYVVSILRGLNVWAWLIAIVGASRQYLNFTTPFWRYFSRISYPFYIFHQTVIVIMAYGVSKFEASISLKYLAIILSTTAISITLSHITIYGFRACIMARKTDEAGATP